jgi:hypothetical protein
MWTAHYDSCIQHTHCCCMSSADALHCIVLNSPHRSTRSFQHSFVLHWVTLRWFSTVDHMYRVHAVTVHSPSQCCGAYDVHPHPLCPPHSELDVCHPAIILTAQSTHNVLRETTGRVDGTSGTRCLIPFSQRGATVEPTCDQHGWTTVHRGLPCLTWLHTLFVHRMHSLTQGLACSSLFLSL